MAAATTVAPPAWAALGASMAALAASASGRILLAAMASVREGPATMEIPDTEEEEEEERFSLLQTHGLPSVEKYIPEAGQDTVAAAAAGLSVLCPPSSLVPES